MSAEYNWSTDITYNVTATAENLEVLRDFAAAVRSEEPDFFGDEDERQIEIGDVVRFGETEDDDSDFESLGPLLNIPGLDDMTDRAGLYVTTWAEEIYTKWAAIAGDFRVWLQILDDSGQSDVTAHISSVKITIVVEEIIPPCGLLNSETFNFISEVTATEQNLEQLQDFVELVRWEDPSFLTTDIGDQVNVGDIVRFGGQGSYGTFEALNELQFMPGLKNILLDAEIYEDEWDADVFTSWAEITGPYQVYLSREKPGEDSDIRVSVTAQGIEEINGGWLR